MANIYKITNTINNMVYIGATKLSLEKRFNMHIKDSRKHVCKNRPLYIDILTYGKENFNITLIEAVDDDEMYDRERFWIKELGSFYNGYNLTFGGKGKQNINYENIINEYNENVSINELADKFCIDAGNLSDVLKNNGFNIYPSYHYNRKRSSKKVMMIKNNVEICIFNTLRDAAKYLLENNYTYGSETAIRTHISHVAQGKRKLAYGFTWKYL